MLYFYPLEKVVPPLSRWQVTRYALLSYLFNVQRALRFYDSIYEAIMCASLFIPKAIRLFKVCCFYMLRCGERSSVYTQTHKHTYAVHVWLNLFFLSVFFGEVNKIRANTSDDASKILFDRLLEPVKKVFEAQRILYEKCRFFMEPFLFLSFSLVLPFFVVCPPTYDLIPNTYKLYLWKNLLFQSIFMK